MSEHCLVDVTTTVRVVINDDAGITQALTPEWAADFYDLRDRGAVLDHLAYNCAMNGIDDASRLEGFANVPQGAITMEAL